VASCFDKLSMTPILTPRAHFIHRVTLSLSKLVLSAFGEGGDATLRWPIWRIVQHTLRFARFHAKHVNAAFTSFA
jgi:hypothetical protein